MSDTKEAAKDTAPAKDGAAAPKAKKAQATPAAKVAKEKKAKAAWTLAKCMKIARRYKSETEWATGASSSYKSATSHGWIAQCCAGMAGGKAKSMTKKSA